LTFSSGSDSGFFVFSLLKSRVPLELVDGNFLLFGFRKQLRFCNLKIKQ
jgi:hypothetical protein